MKLNNSVSGSIAGENIGVSKAFGFEVNAKAFRLLSDNIYKDKIGSIIRELSSNAYDSHVNAGCPEKPFQIHLPTRFEKYFSIRDFGTGLSKDEIHSVYSTYFKSSKENSNDMIGAFGLGSKTPFSYTDSFTIKSYFNGDLFIFAAMVDSDGVPILTEIATESTTENNGLEISFAVNADNFYDFQYACGAQLKFFDVKPTLNCNFSWEAIHVLAQHKNMKVISNDTGAIIKIGQVGYSTSSNELIQKLGDDYYDFFNIFPNVIIDAGIGNVEVTVSREGLSYSPKTIKFLQNFIDEYKDFIFKELKDGWKNAVNDFKRIELIDQFNKPVKIYKMLNLKFDNSEIVAVNQHFYWESPKGVQDYAHMVVKSKKSVTGVQFKTVVDGIPLSGKNKYVLDVSAKYLRWRLAELYTQYDEIYMLASDKLEKMLPVIDPTTLPLPSDFETKKNSIRPTAWKVVQALSHILSASLTSAEKIYEDLEDETVEQRVYVLRGYHDDVSGFKFSSDFLRNLQKYKILKEIYCIRPADKDIVANLPNYISLNDFFDNLISGISNPNIAKLNKISNKLHLMRNLLSTLECSDLAYAFKYSKSKFAVKFRDTCNKLENLVSILNGERDSLWCGMTDIEKIIYAEKSKDYNVTNYIITLNNILANCFESNKNPLQVLKELRNQYFLSSCRDYLIEFMDKELDLAANG